jgi:hypothetical protein
MMAQTSGPLTNQPFTDEQWRDALGDEPGIHGDVDGTSYSLTLANNSDVASVGSLTQDSRAVVAGFPHKIAAGQAQREGVTIPAPTSTSRTDLIVLRYDPAWGAQEPGPVRLHRIAGSEGGGQPTYDAAPPGVEDFPLWAVTRTFSGGQAQALSQAQVRDLRVRVGPNLYPRTLADVSSSVPLGSRAFPHDVPRQYTRVVDAQGNPSWRVDQTGDITPAKLSQDGVAVIPHGLGRVPVAVTGIIAWNGNNANDYDTLIGDVVVRVVDSTAIHFRVRRHDRAIPEWFPNATVQIAWTAR